MTSARAIRTLLLHEANKTSGRSIIKLANAVMEDALLLGASDLHLDPTREGLRARLRIDGLLSDWYLLPENCREELIARFKILAGLRTDERFLPQDGRFSYTSRSGEVVDMRACTLPTHFGENIVLRLLPTLSEPPTLLGLGMQEVHEALARKKMARMRGMVLVTGPTGSGKTTTLYALLSEVARLPVAIVTIEDPVEYTLQGVRQIPVRAQHGLSFAIGLRSILRQDPDVILVGEIRDVDTATIAVQAALTGHLVLATLHTTNARSALLRLQELGVRRPVLNACVSLVISQRLVRVPCTTCSIKRALTSEEAALAYAHMPAAQLPPTHLVPSGCESCRRSGYRGRTGIFELLETRAAGHLGSRSLTIGDDCMHKVGCGMTTVEEFLRVCHD